MVSHGFVFIPTVLFLTCGFDDAPLGVFLHTFDFERGGHEARHVAHDVLDLRFCFDGCATFLFSAQPHATRLLRRLHNTRRGAEKKTEKLIS